MSPSDPDNEHERLRRSLLRFYGALRRRWWIPLLSAAICAAVLVGFSLVKPPVYLATGVVQLGMHAGLDSAEQGNRAQRVDGPFFETHRRLLTSHAVVEDALLRSGEELAEGPLRRRQREQFLEELDIRPVRDTYLVAVEARGEDPRGVVTKVNALMDAFLPFTEDFLGSRYERREQELREREKSLLKERDELESQRRTLLVEAGDQSFEEERRKLNLEEQALQSRLTGLQLQRAKTSAEVRLLKTRLGELRESEELPERQVGMLGENAILVRERVAQVIATRASLARLEREIQPEQLEGLPQQRTLKARLASQRRILREELLNAADSTMRATSSRGEAIQEEVSEVQALIGGVRERLDRLNKIQGRYQSLEGELGFVARELRETRSQLRQVETKTQGDVGATIVDRAEVPVLPEPPLHLPSLIFVLLFGAGLGVLGICVHERIDDRLRSEDDLEGAPLPILGRVPHLDMEGVEELTHVEGSYWVSEAMGLVQTNLSVAAEGLRKRVIMVTSDLPEAGKSFSSAALAVRLAHSGGRTLLIEADLRRPRASKIFGDPRRPGLSDLLRGEGQLSEAVWDSGVEGLEILSAGTPTLSPPDLLRSGDLREVIAAARERYDHVVIDAPPARPLADASLLAPHADGIVFVVRLQHSRERSLREAFEQIGAVSRNGLGLILNDVTPAESPNLDYGYYAETLVNGDPEQQLFLIAPPEERPESPAERRGRRLAFASTALVLAVSAVGAVGQARALPLGLQSVYDQLLGASQTQ